MRFTLVNMLQASHRMFRVPLSFPARQVCCPSSSLPRDVAGCPNVIVDLQSGSQVCDLLRSLLSMDSVDQLQPDLATPITPCFDRVFMPQRKRRCFLPRKARNGTVLLPQRTLSAATIVTAVVQRWRKCKRKCACKDLRCYKELSKDKDFFRTLARWRVGWIMATRQDPIALGERSFYVVFLLGTFPGLLGSIRAGPPGLPCDLRNPLRVLEQALFFMQAPFLVSRVTNETPDSPRSPVQEKRAALLDFLRTAGLPAQPVHDASGKLFLTETRQRANRSHTLLGRTMCSVAFIALTMISTRLYSAASRQARQGRTVWLEQPRKVKATKRTEMITGIWIVVAELHEQSPFAKCESHGLQSLQSLQSGSHPSQKKWNLPFHQKTCLWRLVEKLHGKGQVGVVGGKGLNILDLYVEMLSSDSVSHHGVCFDNMFPKHSHSRP